MVLLRITEPAPERYIPPPELALFPDKVLLFKLIVPKVWLIAPPTLLVELSERVESFTLTVSTLVALIPAPPVRELFKVIWQRLIVRLSPVAELPAKATPPPKFELFAPVRTRSFKVIWDPLVEPEP